MVRLTITRRLVGPAAGLVLAAVLVAACGEEAPTGVDLESHSHGVVLTDGASAAAVGPLTQLRQFSVKFHKLRRATQAGYGLFAAVPLTAADGCISDEQLGGMGYHYTRGDNLADDAVSLLDPEFLVYAPKKGPRKNGVARARLAGFDYLIPYSEVWPGPEDAGFVRAPTTHDFTTMLGIPDIEFAPSRFNAWMFHIWLWHHNPGGMFANWNTAVPLCQGSAF